MIKTHKLILTCLITLILIASLFVIEILTNDSTENEIELVRTFIFPISVGEETFNVSVVSNYSTSPQVSYWEEGKAVYVVFTGDKENSFFNVTVPTDLIGGKISLINKYYEVNEEHYIRSYNGTHNSIYFTFNLPAYVKHFEIRGTQGATTESK